MPSVSICSAVGTNLKGNNTFPAFLFKWGVCGGRRRFNIVVSEVGGEVLLDMGASFSTP